MAISAIKDDTYYTEQGKTAVQAARDTALKDNTTLYTGQTDITNKAYDAQVDAAGKAYDQSYRENAVQKAINERQVAESMANLGLTNSGLNRTQQTAIQLSYANNKAGIDRQRQSALSELDIKRAQDLATIEQNKLSSEAQINQYYDGLAQQYAADFKTSDVSAYESYVSGVNKQAEENSKTTLSKLEYGTLGSIKNASNNNVTYIDSSGNTATMQIGSNPYTGYRHKDVLNKFGEYDKTKVFSNGYQPNNINGTPLKAFKDEKGKKKETFNAYWRTDGKEQKIWEANNKYYVWVGANNQYVEVEYDKQKKDWVFA